MLCSRRLLCAASSTLQAWSVTPWTSKLAPCRFSRCSLFCVCPTQATLHTTRGRFCAVAPVRMTIEVAPRNASPSQCGPFRTQRTALAESSCSLPLASPSACLKWT